jgi:hypothetical protein
VSESIYKYFAYAAFAMAIITFSISVSYVLGYWYGGILIYNQVMTIFGRYSGGDVYGIVAIMMMAG